MLPRGWELHDQRTDRPRLVERAPAERRGATPRRVRVRRRAVATDPDRGTSTLPGFEPVVVPDANGGASRTVPAQFGANDSDDVEVDDEALSTILDARTPLLRRAFRNAQPEA